MPNRKIFSVEGGSVQTNEGLYLRRSADSDLLELCRAGAFAYVLTPRQLGKSSLMEDTAQSLVEEGVKPIIIDLQEIGVKLTAEQWYKGLITKIEEQTTLKTNISQWWETHSDLGMGQRLVRFMKDVLLVEVEASQRIVIFVDEIDTTLSLDFTDDFFTAIRAIYSARTTTPQFRRLSFVLIGVAAPTDLISDPKRTPFNIGRRVELTDFTFEEVLPLAEGLKLPVDEAKRVLKWVISWTGGHPFLTQRLCYAIAKQHRDGWTEEDVDRVVAGTFFGEASSEDKSNIEFVRDMLTKRAPDREAVIKTYGDVLRGEQPVVDEESLIKSHLKLSGIVRSDDGILRVRNRIYSEVFNQAWVKKNTPTNWTRRLTRAAAALAIIFLFLSAPVGAFAIYQWRQAAAALNVARKEREEANNQREQAVRLAELARVSAERERLASSAAEDARRKAETSAAKEKEAAGKERLAREDAEKQRQRAMQLAESARTAAAKEKTAKEAAVKSAEEARKAAEGERVAKEEAEKQRKLAERNQLTAQALASQRQGKLLQQSVLLASASLRDDYSSGAYEVLSQGLALLPQAVRSWKSGDRATDIAFSANGKYVLTAAKRVTLSRPGTASNTFGGSTLFVGNVSDGEKVFSTPSSGKELGAIVFSPDRSFLATLDIQPAGITVLEPIRVWKWEEGGQLTELHSITVKDTTDVFALSPNGTYLAVAKRNYDGDIVGGEVSSRKQLGMTGVSEPTTPAATAEPREFLTLVELQTKREINLLPTTFSDSVAEVKAITFSAQQDLMATGASDGTVLIWKREGNTFRDYLRFRPGIGISAIAFSPDGNYIVTATSDQIARVWRLNEKPNPSKEAKLITTMTGHEGRINAIAFSPKGEYMATASADGTARLWGNWQTDTPGEVARITHEMDVTSVKFSPDGKFVTSAGLDTARMWKVPGTYEGTAKPLGNAFYSGSITQNRRFFGAVGSSVIEVWDMGSGVGPDGAITSPGRKIFSYEVKIDDRRIDTVVISEDGKYVATLTPIETGGQPQARDNSRILRLWNTDTKQVLWSQELDETEPFRLETVGNFSPGNKYLGLPLRVKDKTEVRFFDVNKGKEVARRTVQSFGDLGLIFTPDGEHLVAVDEGAVRVREILTGRQVGPAINVPTLSYKSVFISRTGKYVALRDKTMLSVSDTTTGEQIFSRPLTGEREIVISPNEKQIVLPGSAGIEVLTIAKSPTVLAELPYEDIEWMAFNETGEYIVVTDDSTVHVWSISGKREVASIKTPADVALFSTDGKYLLAGNLQGVTVYRWQPDDLLSEVCKYVTRNLSLEEWRDQYLMGNRELPKPCPGINEK